MKNRKFRLATIQMSVLGGELNDNLQRALKLISEAKNNGADIIVLPECMDLGWMHPSSSVLASEIPGGIVCAKLCDAARKHGLYICSGLTEKCGDSVFNSAILIDDSGEILCNHRKINELEVAHEFYAQGNKLSLSHTKYGAIGVLICADARAKDEVLLRSLGYMGADIVLSPSAWAVPSSHDNNQEPYGDMWTVPYSKVAHEFNMHIVGVSNVGAITSGPWEGMNCIGCSIAVNDAGKIILKGSYGKCAENIYYLDIELRERPTRGNGWFRHWDKVEQDDGGNSE